MTPQPVLTNFRMRTVADAQRVAELASAGSLRATEGYLRCKDQDSVTVGHVYAFRTVPGLRWSDGLRSKTDPSSTHRTEFLTYPIPHPPPRAGVEPGAGWVRMRKTFAITRADGGVEEWEIAAYDYDKHDAARGAHFRTLADLGVLLPVPGAADAAASHPVSDTHTQTGASDDPPSPGASTSMLLADTAPRVSPAPSAWSLSPTSPVASPHLHLRLRAPRLFRSPSPGAATRFRPYARRCWCDEEMIARFSRSGR